MQNQALRARYRRILRFSSWVLAQTWWFELVLPKFGLARFVERKRVARLTRQARGFYRLAADLGGLMVKVGQFLSARLDVLPEVITKELSGLQDEVEPQSFDLIQSSIEASLGMPLNLAFETFDQQPIAAASLGQAYRATLSPGLAADTQFSEVIVKVLRPGIEEIVDTDLRALRKVAVWLSRVKLVSKRTDAIALVEEFATTTLQEIDYLNEADNLERFASDFAADERISTPVVVWERSAKRVLTLSNVASIKIADTESLIAAGIDPNAVAAELARCTFEQFFITGFFHADPHPGNLFIKPNPNGRPGDFTLTYIDFGMMGQIDAEMRNNLQQFLFAVASRDARGWVAACERLGVLLPSADTVVLQDAVEKLFQRFAGVKVTELVQTDPKEIRQFAMQFSEIIRTLPFQLPNDFLFLIRALSLISGVASTLNRDFNIWDAIDPFARTLLKNRQSGLTRGLGQSVFGFLTTAARLPQRLEELARKLERNEVVIRNPELEKRVRSLDSSVRRTTAAIIFGALFVTGFITIDQSELASGLCFGFSVLPFLYAVGVGRLKL